MAIRNKKPKIDNEDEFVSGGSAEVNSVKPTRKTKPVTISLSEKNLSDIKDIIVGQVVSGKSLITRTDVIRAAVYLLKEQTEDEIRRLILLSQEK